MLIEMYIDIDIGTTYNNNICNFNINSKKPQLYQLKYIKNTRSSFNKLLNLKC